MLMKLKLIFLVNFSNNGFELLYIKKNRITKKSGTKIVKECFKILFFPVDCDSIESSIIYTKELIVEKTDVNRFSRTDADGLMLTAASINKQRKVAHVANADPYIKTQQAVNIEIPAKSSHFLCFISEIFCQARNKVAIIENNSIFKPGD
jgi:hypothetical protein